jgi:DNA mismatch repair protein MutS2
MEAHAAKALEFDAIREALARLTSTPIAARLASALEPDSDPDTVQQSLRRTTAMRDHLSGRALPVHDVGDPSPLLTRAALAGSLDGPELVQVGALLRALRLSRKLLKPVLADLGEQDLPEFPDLEEYLLRSLSPEGQLRDKASPTLATLRRRNRTLAARLRSLMEEEATKSSVRAALQSPTPTTRDGRPVLAVRSDRRRDVPGVLHGRSASGETVFVEPTRAVEHGNKLRESLEEERAEERRILRELSAEVGRHAHRLEEGLQSLARLDLLAAKATLAERMEAVEPRMSGDGRLELMGARHPLLKGEVVPIAISLDRQRRTLLLTGPNTGGKTVALKTVGLLTLMAHAGLHVPALDGTVLPLILAAYCDIGDEQSIEQNLSTFSSHMKNIVDLMSSLRQRPKQHALVLLDELGAGTDPAEGAALASAITLWLHRWNPEGLRVIITTHFSSLKRLALETPEMENASVEFDAESLSPTYRILMGWPGTSRALLVAERLGLEPDIVAEAEALVGADHAQTEETLSRLEEARRELEEQQRAAQDAARAAQLEADRYREKLARWGTEKEKLRQHYEQEARQILAQARRSLATPGPPTKRAQAELREAFAPPRPAPVERLPETELTVGRAVRVVSLGQNGVLLGPPDRKGEVTVLVGALRVRAKADDLAGAEMSEQQRLSAPATVPEVDDPGCQLVLIGKRAEAALAEVDRYLDQATLAGLEEVLLIHGVGPGELAKIVRSRLDESPLVRSWRSGKGGEGGAGVTVVRLA